MVSNGFQEPVQEVKLMKEEVKLLLERIKDLKGEFNVDRVTPVHVTRWTRSDTVKQTVHLSIKPFFDLLTAMLSWMASSTSSPKPSS